MSATDAEGKAEVPFAPGSINSIHHRGCQPLGDSGLHLLAEPHPCRSSFPKQASVPIGVHRGRQQGVRGRVHLARHPVQCHVRGPLPPGHLPGPALHRPQTGGDRPAGGGQVRVSRRHRKGEAGMHGVGGRRRQGGQGVTGGQATDGLWSLSVPPQNSQARVARLACPV